MLLPSAIRRVKITVVSCQLKRPDHVLSRGQLRRRIVEAGGDLGVQNKGDDAHFDPQTVADVTAEKLIVGSLRKAWPGIAIVGEEGVEAVDEKFVVVPHTSLLTAAMAEGRAPRPKWGTATLGNVVVFVDPLDGTKEFTEGITSAVTVLIGIALDGRSVSRHTHTLSQDTLPAKTLPYLFHYPVPAGAVSYDR